MPAPEQSGHIVIEKSSTGNERSFGHDWAREHGRIGTRCAGTVIWSTLESDCQRSSRGKGGDD